MSASSAASVGSEAPSSVNGQQSTHPSSSSEFNSPMSSPSPYPSFAVPLIKLPSTSSVAAVLVDYKSTAAVATTVPSLARPVQEPAGGDSSPEAVRCRMWKAIAVEDIPKVKPRNTLNAENDLFNSVFIPGSYGENYSKEIS